MNVHTPERQANESQADYRKRRHASREALKAMRPANSKGSTNGREQLRQSQRKNKGALRGIFGRGLQRVAARLRAEAMPKVGVLRDESGFYTLTGRDPLRRIGVNGAEVRRMWLAGISAQRGY